MDCSILIIKNRPNDAYIGCDGATKLKSTNGFFMCEMTRLNENRKLIEGTRFFGEEFEFT